MGGCESCPPTRYAGLESVSVFYFDSDWAELEQLTIKEATPHEAAAAVYSWLQYLADRGKRPHELPCSLQDVASMTVEVNRG